MPKRLKAETLAIDGGTPVRTAPWGDGPSHYAGEMLSPLSRGAENTGIPTPERPLECVGGKGRPRAA